jgi:uncharacterized phage protein (TIGR01671 family)
MNQREIKFRAWDKKNKVMAVPMHLSYRDSILETVHYADKGGVYLHNPEEYELMQYTGLKDKNGKECFEGDIVKRVYEITKAKKPKETIEQIIYCDEDGSFMFSRAWAHGRGWSRAYSGHKVFPWEIIGNIYENPELLK